MKREAAQHCTRAEMIDRFDEEVSRAIRLDWPDDYIDQVRRNRCAFLRGYADMGPSETIAEFEGRQRLSS